ncbi:DUF2461 domain-containing protein [Pedobacter frigiditerrae]|uniref:DUF2461 domain-containing protein n=1 Tax=Pedobacter frigiditerrae TaxID=2530452 RepID=A0A4V2MJ97_9SPHI|nr:DUF2461 domain-containing protein [Pedobacter frigiditerrae]TCC93306.1 DUF2461 domain-containing protein [Pedobacter frigiditerrae]
MLNRKTFDFLNAVTENNNREWFAENKHLYEEAKEDLFPFIAKLIKELAAIDPAYSASTEPKKALMRIYRDVRFSKNKDPYKKNYGIAFDVKGYGPRTPSYYLHLQPDNCFFGVGFWQPEAPVLKSIREEIDYGASEFLEIINAKDFKSIYKLSEEDKLKKAPKGYDVDHPQIDLLKLKSFIAIYKIKDEEFFKPEIVNKLITAFKTIQPFVLFLRKATDIG